MSGGVNAVLPRIPSLRRRVVALAFADVYELERETLVDDGKGSKRAVPQIVEAGRCALRRSNLQGQERVSGERAVDVVAYGVVLPYDTVARAADKIRINGRPFRVGTVSKGGELGLTAAAELSAWGSDR